MYFISSTTTPSPLLLLLLIIQQNQISSSSSILPLLFQPPWQKRLFLTKDLNNTSEALQCILQLNNYNQLFCFRGSNPIPIPSLTTTDNNKILDIQTIDNPQIVLLILTSTCVIRLTLDTDKSNKLVVLAGLCNSISKKTRTGPILYSRFSSLSAFSVATYTELEEEEQQKNPKILKQTLYKIFLDTKRNSNNVLLIANDAWVQEIPNTSFPSATAVSLAVASSPVVLFVMQYSPFNLIMFYTFHSLSNNLQLDPNLIHWNRIPLDVQTLFHNSTLLEISTFKIVSVGNSFFQLWIAMKQPYILQIQFMQRDLKTWTSESSSSSSSSTSNFWKNHSNIVMFEIPYTIHGIQWNDLYGLIGYNYEDENKFMLIADTDFKSNVQEMFYDTIFCTSTTATNNPSNSLDAHQNFNKCMQGYIQIDPLTCIPCPRGGYAYLSHFVPCPKGTYNNKTGATNIMACIPCPLMSIAQNKGSALCTACNLTHLYQSLDGTECLHQCPSHQQTMIQDLKCIACPDNMMVTASKCTPCPDNRMVSSNGSPCSPCPSGFFLNPGTKAFCVRNCSFNSCSPDGKSECTFWDPIPMVDTIYYDFKLETKSTPPLDLWLSTNEITSLVSFRNGTILAFTFEPFLLVEVQFTTIPMKPKIQILSLSQHRSFFPIPFKKIQAIVMTRDESKIYAADPSTGIILKISNWDMKNPSQSFEYKMVNNSHSPISLALPPPTSNNLSLPELYFLSSNSSNHYGCCYHSIRNHQIVETYMIPMIATINNNVTHLWHITSTNTRPNILYFLAHLLPQQKPGIIALDLLEQTAEILFFIHYPQWYTQPLLFYYRENSNDTFIIALNNTIVSFSTTMTRSRIEAGQIEETGYVDDEGENARISKILAISPIQAEQQNSHSTTSFIFIDKISPALHLRILFYRPCECAKDFFYEPSIKACVPCPQGFHSMTGSRQCTPCDAGFYRENSGSILQQQRDEYECNPCPLHLWWWSMNNAEIDSCSRMHNGLMISPTITEQPWKLSFQEIQRQLTTTRHQNAFYPWDIQSSDLLWKTITIPSSGKINLFESDTMGYFWSYINNPLISPPSSVHFNNKTQITFNIPGIWIPCISSPTMNDMKLLETCECIHPGLLNLTLPLGNPWDSYRWEFVQNTSSFFLPLYAFRLHTNPMHNTRLILLSQTTKMNLTTNFTTTDTGTCWMGWPASYNCTSPTHIWVYPTEEYPTGACVACPEGTFAPFPSSIQCINPLSSTLYELCKPGTYAKPRNQNNNNEGIMCDVCPTGTYSSMIHVSECTRKTTKCPMGYYVDENLLVPPSEDNECKLCEPCNTTTHVMYPYNDWSIIYARCDGIINYRPFICISKQDSIKGYSATVLQHSTASIFKYNVWYYPCLDDSPTNKNNLYEWQTGQFPDLCYIQCKYGIQSTAAWNYYKSFQLLAGDVWTTKWSIQISDSNDDNLQWQQKNLFPMINPIQSLNSQSTTTFILLRSLMKSVCSTCDLSPCPELMWRPIYPHTTNGCGAPCMINPELCAPNRTDGCVFLCDIPKNAFFIAYYKENSTCTWQCKDGWFLDDTRTECLDCTPLHCVQGTSYIGIEKCKPTLTLSQVCTGCPSSPQSLPLGLNLSTVQNQPGKCLYECFKEGVAFYKNQNPFTNLTKPCIPCDSIYNINNVSENMIVCPQGYMPQCGLEPCGQCPSLVINHQQTTMIPPFSYVMSKNRSKTCRVMCNPNFNTLDAKTLEILPTLSDDGYDPQTITCQSCTNSIDFPCDPLLLYCPKGETITKNTEKCETCKTSLDLKCPPGTKAPPCPGGRVMQISDSCVECSRMQNLIHQNDQNSPSNTLIWPVRFFVPYEDALDKRRGNDNTGVMIIDNDNNNEISIATTLLQFNHINIIECPFACMAGMIFVNGSCVACSSLYPSNLIPSHYPYDTYYSLWNASVGTRWWQEQYDPKHLGVRLYNPLTGDLLLETQSGKCWPCPKKDNDIFKANYIYNSGEYDLCNAIKYSNPQQNTIGGGITTTTEQPIVVKTQTVTQSIQGLFAQNTLQNKLFLQLNTQSQKLTRKPKLIGITSTGGGRRRLFSMMLDSMYNKDFTDNNTDTYQNGTRVDLDLNKYHHNISFLITMAKRLRWLQTNSTQINQNNSLIIHECPIKGHYRAPPMGYWCEPCPENHYCPFLLTINPIPCPAFSTTLSRRGAFNKTDCICIPGFTPHHSMHTNQQQWCIPSRFVDSPNTMLSDKDWYYRMKVFRYCQHGYYYASTSTTNTWFTCLPCPPGTFEKNEICHLCPLYSVSTHAQTQCTCMKEASIFPQYTESRYLTSTHTWLEQSLDSCKANEEKEREDCPTNYERHRVTGKCMHEEYEYCKQNMNNAVYDPITESCLCPPGMMFDPFSLSCVTCPKGSYSPTLGRSPCIQCPSNMPYTSKKGSTMYIDCEEKEEH